jgi:hypothetical protein
MIPAIERQSIKAAYTAIDGGVPSCARRTPMLDRPGAFLPDQIPPFPVPTRA